MKRGWLGCLLASATLACSDARDVVFRPVTFSFAQQSDATAETTGRLRVAVTLSEPLAHEATVEYWVKDGTTTAHDACDGKDHRLAAGVLRFPAGQTVAYIEGALLDDHRPEIDESFELTLSAPVGAALGDNIRHRHTILDDDRTALVNVAHFGAKGDGATDDTGALRAALTSAPEGSVVVFPAGRYRTGELGIRPGVSYHGPAAVLTRLPGQLDGVRTLVASWSGAEDSLPLVIEGVTLDGAREEQGPYQQWQYADAALLALAGDPAAPGRLRVIVESVTLQSGVDDGLVAGPNVDLRVCGLKAQDLWRDALAMRGGHARLHVTELYASAHRGTAGLVIAPGTDRPGFGGNLQIDAELEDVRLGSGDLEVRLHPGSRLMARRLVMEDAPFFIRAPGAVVRISSSVFWSAIPREGIGHFEEPSDVLFEDTDFHLAERLRDGNVRDGDSLPALAEADRELIVAQVRFAPTPLAPADAAIAPGAAPVQPDPHRLTFSHCRYFVADDVEPEDRLFVAGTVGPSVHAGDNIHVLGGQLAARYAGVFAPACVGCSYTP